MERAQVDRYPDVQESTDVKEKEADITYRSVGVNSFSTAVEDILISRDENTVCMLDVDGVLIENRLTQYPGICHFVPHNVAQEVQRSAHALISSLGQDAVCVATNRDENVKIVWSSNIIVSTVQTTLEKLGFGNVKIFTSLNKQIPNASRKKRDILVDHYVNYVRENDVEDRLKLCIVEDGSLLALKRSVFPKEIARKVQERVKEELDKDIGVDVVDYVLKK